MARMIQCPECPPDAPLQEHEAKGLCRKHYNRRYHQRHYEQTKDRRKAAAKQYYHSNRDRCRARMRAYYVANCDKIRRQHRIHEELNYDAVNARRERYRRSPRGRQLRQAAQQRYYIYRIRPIRRLAGVLPRSKVKRHLHPNYAGGEVVTCSAPGCEKPTSYKPPSWKNAKYGHFCPDHRQYWRVLKKEMEDEARRSAPV